MYCVRRYKASSNSLQWHLKELAMRKKAFTLVELLVVISIISLLACLLLPALFATVKVARATDCGNNLRQLGFAHVQYQDDGKDTLAHYTNAERKS